MTSRGRRRLWRLLVLVMMLAAAALLTAWRGR
jgi:hypothetical protein